MNEEEVQKGFQNRLNRQGYSFQYAMINLIRENPHGWKVEVPEFPVEVQEKGTRIDFILRYPPNVFLVAECKRANPALSNWCFARATKASHWMKTRLLDQAVFELYVPPKKEQPPAAIVDFGGRDMFDQWRSERIYHVACEVKTKRPGDPGGQKDEIESAVTQVLRGMNGLADWISQNSNVLYDDKDYTGSAAFMPVIFTTANLYTSEADLGQADLSTGDLDIDNSEFKQVNWLHYQYYMSPGLLSSLPLLKETESLIEALHHGFARTIAIVNPNGLDSFFKWIQCEMA